MIPAAKGMIRTQWFTLNHLGKVRSPKSPCLRSSFPIRDRTRKRGRPQSAVQRCLQRGHRENPVQRHLPSCPGNIPKYQIQCRRGVRRSRWSRRILASGVARLSQTFEQVDTDLPCHDGGHHDFNDGEIGQEKLTHDDIVLVTPPFCRRNPKRTPTASPMIS